MTRAHLRIGLASKVDLNAKRVAVQPRALVPRRHVRQAMGRFDLENLEDMHAAILTGPARRPFNRSFQSRG
jgi:hypothetical protein